MFLFISILIGCSSEIEQDRYAKDRVSLPVAAIPHLPDHGFILISNGYDRRPERITADLSRSRLKWITPNETTLSVWENHPENSKALSRGESHLLQQQWEAAFIEPPSKTSDISNERYDEILILVDGSKSRTIRSRGPLREEHGKAVTETLRLYVGETKTQQEQSESAGKTVESP